MTGQYWPLTLNEAWHRMITLEDVDTRFPPGHPSRIMSGIYDRRHEPGCIFRYGVISNPTDTVTCNCQTRRKDMSDPYKTDRRFWMVWSPQGHAPTRSHATHVSAVEEAQRLSQKHAGHTFYVLVAEKGFCKPKPYDEWALS